MAKKKQTNMRDLFSELLNTGTIQNTRPGDFTSTTTKITFPGISPEEKKKKLAALKKAEEEAGVVSLDFKKVK